MEIKKITEGMTGERAARIIYENDLAVADAAGAVLSIFDKGGALFAGIAKPDTDPGPPQKLVYYLASTPGVYALFNAEIEVEANELAVLFANLGVWMKKTIIRIGNDWSEVEVVAKSLEALHDIIYGGVLSTKEFATGPTGHGARIDQDGVAEVQYLKVREGVETPTLVKNNIVMQGAERWVSDYGVIREVITEAEYAVVQDGDNEPICDENEEPLLADLEPLGGVLVNFAANGGYGHTFQEDDILRAAMQREDGTPVTAWFKVERVYSPASVVVTPIGEAPDLIPGLVLARQGNLSDPARQNSIYVSGRDGYLRFLAGVNSPEIGPENIVLEIAPGAFKLPEGIIGGEAIKPGTISALQLAVGAVATKHLEDGAVTEPKIAGGAITGEKVAKGTISGDKLAENLVLPEGTSAATPPPGDKGAAVATTEYVQRAIEQYAAVDYTSLEEQMVPGEFWPSLDGKVRQVYIRTFQGEIEDFDNDRSLIKGGVNEAHWVRGGFGLEQTCVPPGMEKGGAAEIWSWSYIVYGGHLILSFDGSGSWDGLKYNITFKYTKE